MKFLYAQVPIATDTRIKTFVYNESEVYPLVVHYGYKPNIEFAIGEEIQLISIGKNYAWDFSAEGRRLFIEPLEPNSHTNMTVVTNKRTYQFDLESKDPTEGIDDELIYVAKFYYPAENFDKSVTKIVDTKKFLPQMAKKTGKSSSNNNFEYSYVGPDSLAPEKIFDDGKSTYFAFPNNNANIPHIFILSPDGREIRASYSIKGEYVVLKGVVGKYLLRMGDQVVCIFNERA